MDERGFAHVAPESRSPAVPETPTDRKWRLDRTDCGSRLRGLGTREPSLLDRAYSEIDNRFQYISMKSTKLTGVRKPIYEWVFDDFFTSGEGGAFRLSRLSSGACVAPRERRVTLHESNAL